jgi:hypothetical protein
MCICDRSIFNGFKNFDSLTCNLEIGATIASIQAKGLFQQLPSLKVTTEQYADEERFEA